MLSTVASSVCFAGTHFSGFNITYSNTLMLKKFFSHSKRSFYYLLARVKPS